MSIEVVRADGLVTVQDQGRIGYAHLGVPTGGALDRGAAALANRLVGNDRSAAVLETTLFGLAVRVRRALTAAVTGAPCPVTVDGRAGPFGEPISLRSGAELVIGPADRGVRSYLAVSGGIAVRPVLGSRCTDTLAGVGPPPVAAGMVLPVGSGGAPRPVDVRPPERADAPLRLLPGPRADWFGDRAWDVLTSQEYAVGADSNRVGLRLRGATLDRSVPAELASEGLLAGAVQVPPDGQPVVMLADHPTTGGYPVLAVVVDDDLDRCAQLRPGDPVRFTPWGARAGSAPGRRR